jgi:hypothetical protein
MKELVTDFYMTSQRQREHREGKKRKQVQRRMNGKHAIFPEKFSVEIA